MKITCCGLVWDGPDALERAVEHRHKAHPETVRGKRYPSLAARAKAARESGQKAARDAA